MAKEKYLFHFDIKLFLNNVYNVRYTTCDACMVVFILRGVSVHTVVPLTTSYHPRHWYMIHYKAFPPLLPHLNTQGHPGIL